MSKSKEEEFIGILWLILTILLFQNNIRGWWIATLVLGILCQIFSIILAFQQKKILKLKQSLKEGR